MLYAHAFIAQATVVVNACLVAWIFQGRVPAARSIAWVAVLSALAGLRLALVWRYRRRGDASRDVHVWARRFTIGSALTGVCWGAAAVLFYVPSSPTYQVFLAFVLGGMTAGAAASNASYAPAFVAFAAPALLPMVVRFAAERDPVHAAMAFMLALFGVAVAGISRNVSGAMARALGLRFRNEALVEHLTAALASDEQKTQFIAVLSHELRNPLAPIRSSLYLLEHAAPGSETSARAREIIHRQTEHLARLVDDLLDVTRISRGKLELQRSRVDAREIVRRACDDYRAAFHDRDVELRVETADPAWIDADEARVAQVVGNLLHNAAKFSRAGGTVVARVVAGGGQAEIHVRDDGVGIEPGLLPHVFEPFVQSDGGLARPKGGLGLGLSLVKAVVELHGGSVRAHSEGVDRGAELVVTFPLVPAPRRPAPTHAPVVSPVSRPTSVLVIEDNLDSAHSIADVLAMEGHRVDVATDARSGIAMALELRPEVILCDIGLPDLDGYELARTLRADDRLRETRFVALSGYAQPEDRRRAAEAGFDQHVAKPASIDLLLSVVASGSRR